VKVLLISICLATVPLGARGQFFNYSHVPKEARIVFHDLYPNAADVDWVKAPEGYEAGFVFHKRQRFVLFSSDGKYLGEISEIGKKSLPKRIRKHLRETYAGFRMENAAIIKTIAGEVRYEMQIGHAGEEYKLVFNDSGYVLEVLPIPLALAE